MICIICKNDFSQGEFDDEHVFPESIGGSFCLKTCLCKTCNHRLGAKVDSLLVDHFLIKLARYNHRIPNKNGVVTNPFGTGTDNKDPTKKISWSSDKKGNMQRPHLYPSFSCEKRTDGSFDIKIDADKSDMDEIVEMIQKCLERKHGAKFSKEDLEKQILPSLKSGSKHVTIAYHDEIGINDHMPCIVKIAYEMTYYWLGRQYLNDKQGEKLRNFLFDMTHGMSAEDALSKNKINGFVDFVHDKTPMFEIPCDDCHVALIFKEQDKILCYVKIFDAFEGVFCVSEKASLYPNFENRCILLDYKAKKYSECSKIII